MILCPCIGVNDAETILILIPISRALCLFALRGCSWCFRRHNGYDRPSNSNWFTHRAVQPNAQPVSLDPRELALGHLMDPWNPSNVHQCDPWPQWPLASSSCQIAYDFVYEFSHQAITVSDKQRLFEARLKWIRLRLNSANPRQVFDGLTDRSSFDVTRDIKHFHQFE